MHLRHRRDQTRALSRGQWIEQARGGLVGAPIHFSDFPSTGRGPPSPPEALVLRSRAQADETLLLQGLDQAGDVSGIEAKAPAQVAQVCPLGTDLVEQARLSQRAIAPEEVIVQRSDALGDQAVELPDLQEISSASIL